MASALDLRNRGLEFVRDEHASIVTVRGPKSAALEAKTEVDRRVAGMRNPPRLSVENGRCDACGDALIPPQTGGWCELCTLGRRMALRGGGG